ncbi:hypothetical protein LLE49_03085 [Alicyclobacillus tolerans]|uniref:hypothetical protein n=1 Tax=Alicyclobacillus tolerans TaxID=90970 RepID=UPI001F33AE0C|nr:hypothetical protein [Alicyclobacillus tolerans]MCF8563723.1 hypothetical protein [Alicyclobacillus tolerans]
MNQTLWEDAIVYAALILAVFLYSGSLYRGMYERKGQNAARKFAWGFRTYSILWLTYVTVVGCLHQLGMLPKALTYALIALAVAAFIFGMIRLRRAMRHEQPPN